MKIDYGVLGGEERLILALRTLYCGKGYRQYSMSRFEDYDLYSRNKDFLISDHLITFTDTNGKLKALKPDVTLSIIKNYRETPGTTEKLCYNESVFRVSRGTGAFRELTQTGLECIGAVGDQELNEVLTLAGNSLAAVSERYVLEISDLDILSCFMDDISDDAAVRETMLRCVEGKNLHEMEKAAETYGLDIEKVQRLQQLVSLVGKPEKVSTGLLSLTAGTPAEATAKELLRRLRTLAETIPEEHLLLDFSLVSNMKYYNGIMFQGFIFGVSDSVLSGGQYDRLMQRMGKKAKAVGFAVYLDALERFDLPV